MKQFLGAALGAMLAVCAGSAAAQTDEAGKAAAKQLVESLHWRDGDIAVPGAKASFHLGSQFHYLEQADARRVVEQLWGNPPDEDVLGLVVPRDADLLADESWAVVVTYSDEGHVADEDAASMDYPKLLGEMQEATREGNDERRQAGFDTVELVGWAEPPHYDAATKKLYWAKELAFGGGTSHTLNYDIRVLGREGFLSLNAVAGMDRLAAVRSGMQQLLPMAEFDSGARYADYDPKTDKLAAYGLAALIGGGIAAKAGLFAKLGVLLLGLKKLLVPLVLGAVAFGRKLLGRSGDKGVVS